MAAGKNLVRLGLGMGGLKAANPVVGTCENKKSVTGSRNTSCSVCLY